MRVALFGKLTISSSAKGSKELPSSKAQELLCFLVLHRGRPLSRDFIASTLWADQPPARARQYLRKALWQMQTAFATGELPLHIQQDELAIREEKNLWVDASSFEDAFQATRSIPGRELMPAQAGPLTDAVALYQGDLLEGWYQEWCLIERERFEVMYLSALDKLTSYCESRRQYELGIQYGLASIAHDRAREHTHRALMRLYFLAGDRTSAVRQFERCAAALKQDLGLRPSPRTLALLERIRQGNDAATEATPPQETQSEDGDGLHSLLDSIRQLRIAALDVERNIARHLQSRGPKP